MYKKPLYTLYTGRLYSYYTLEILLMPYFCRQTIEISVYETNTIIYSIMGFRVGC